MINWLHNDLAPNFTVEIALINCHYPVTHDSFVLQWGVAVQNNPALPPAKTEKLAAVDGAGRYQTNSKFKLPADAKGKNYTVKTALVSNGKTYKENAYKVTVLDGQLQFAALY
jgi:hypothetical protein